MTCDETWKACHPTDSTPWLFNICETSARLCLHKGGLNNGLFSSSSPATFASSGSAIMMSAASVGRILVMEKAIYLFHEPKPPVNCRVLRHKSRWRSCGVPQQREETPGVNNPSFILFHQTLSSFPPSSNRPLHSKSSYHQRHQLHQNTTNQSQRWPTLPQS